MRILAHSLPVSQSLCNDSPAMKSRNIIKFDVIHLFKCNERARARGREREHNLCMHNKLFFHMMASILSYSIEYTVCP